MNRTSELIASLIEELERSPQCPNMQELHDLANALHGSMCAVDAPELNWMPLTFEDLADNITNAEKCVNRAEDEKQFEINKYGRQYTDDDIDRLRENGGL